MEQDHSERRTSGTVAAIAVLVLFADAAIETARAGSPTSYVAIGSALCFAVTIALWLRRIDGRILASVGSLLLLSLVALASWLGRDSSDGIRMLGLGTSSIVHFAAACSVGLAVVMLWGAGLPRWTRPAIALVGIHGVTAFIHAAFANGAFAFGDDPWGQLPVPLQGTVLGGFVLVPAALAVTAVRLGLRRPPRGSTQRLLQQCAALVLTLVMLLTTMPARSVAPQSTATEDTSDAPNSRTAPQAAAAPDAVDALALLDAVDRSVTQVKRAEWDVEARADVLGDGYEAAFALVRDEIGYEPYAGVLRGAQTTYAARAGNAADRALLLARLLNLRGTHTRFVFGHLNDQLRDRLLMRTFESVQDPRTLPAAKPGSLQQRIFERGARDYERVRAALGDGLQPVTSPGRTEVLDEMNPHVWVQVEAQDGWIDLDPSFPEARVGQVFATPERTAEEIPEDLYQHVTMRIVAETVANGVLTPRTLLESVRRSVDVAHVQIAVLHSQERGLGGLGSAIAGALGKGSAEWIPMFWVNGQTTTGEKLDITAPGFVAEWLEFELSWPGGRRETTRRALASRGDATWRERTPLDTETLQSLRGDDRGPFEMQAVHNIWLSAGPLNVADYVDAIAGLLFETALKETAEARAEPVTDEDIGQSLWPFAIHNLTAMFWSDHISIPLVNDTPGARLYADGPRIAVFSTVPSEGDHVQIVTDLRRDNIRGLAVEGAGRTLAEQKLRFGILQGALEHEFAWDLAVAWNGDATGLESTSSRLADGQLSVLTRANVPDALKTSARAGSALIRQALVRDSTVVTTISGGEVGQAWWDINARTGDTQAVGDSGLQFGVLDLLGKGAKQMNGLNPPKTYDLREWKELVAERNRNFHKMIEARNRANPSRLQKSGNARGGGSEYGVLLVAVGIAANMALWAMSAWVESRVYAELLTVIDWIKAGGFRHAVGLPAANQRP